MTTPVQDPNPPANPPDTTVNGGSDFSGQPGRAYVAPEDLDSAYVAAPSGTKDTANAGAAGTDGSLTGIDSGTTVTPRDTSGNDGRTASGAVVNTAYSGTPNTQSAGGAPGTEGTNPYQVPQEMVYAGDSVDTTGVTRRADVVEDNDPNALPSGYSLSHYDTTGVGTRQTTDISYTPPGSPTGVTATAVDSRREVVVSWTPGTAPVGAEIKRWVVEGNTTGTKIVPAHEHQTVMSEGLVAGQEYRFTVYAETDFGTGYRSAPSAPVTVSNLDQIADVNYIEDDRANTYEPDGTFTVKPDET